MLLKPKTAEVYLIYECPKCRCEWGKTPKEVIRLPGFVCQGCNTYSEFEPIAKVRVIPDYVRRGETVNKPPNKDKNSATPGKAGLTEVQRDAILALTSLGFPKKESKKFVAGHNFASIETYVQAAIREGTCENAAC